jgi:hypothetical protein
MRSLKREDDTRTPAINELAASAQRKTDTAPRYCDRHCYPGDDVVAHGPLELAASSSSLESVSS